MNKQRAEKKKKNRGTQIESQEQKKLSEPFLPSSKRSKKKAGKMLKKAIFGRFPKKVQQLDLTSKANDGSASEQSSSASTLSPLPIQKKDAKKIVKNNRTLVNLAKTSGKRYRRNRWKLAPIILSSALAAYLGINQIRALIINNQHSDSHQFTADRVFDDSPEIQDGQVVFDKMSEEEKALLLKSFSNLVVQDANARILDESATISNVKDVLSISLLPCNLEDNSNEFDKYYLSILFQNENDVLYTLNYLTGKDFESDAETTKQFFIDFTNYLNFDCALDNCSKMSEKAQSILGKLEDAIFVGEPYWGFTAVGNDLYYVPIYSNHDAVAYSAPCAPIDSYELAPLDVFEKQLAEQQKEPFEQVSSTTKSENLQKILDIYHEQLQTPQKQEKNMEK